MALMEGEFNEQEQDARQEFESAREEIKNKNQEEYNVLRFTVRTWPPRVPEMARASRARLRHA